MLKNTVKDAILMLHGVDLLLVSRTLPKRLAPSGINAMRLVHKNSTGQPWHCAGYPLCVPRLGGLHRAPSPEANIHLRPWHKLDWSAPHRTGASSKSPAIEMSMPMNPSIADRREYANR